MDYACIVCWHIVYDDGETVKYTIRISGTWTDDYLYLNSRTPTITVDSSTGNAYVFIINAGTANHIYYKKFTASGSTWDANWTDYIDESSDGSCNYLNSPFYMKSGTDLLCFYQTGTASSANLKVSYVAAGGGTYNLTNSPSSIDFGVIQPSTTYYAYGSAPSNPVTDAQCTFTITNGQANAIKVNIQATNFTGGGGWTLGAPDGTHARLIAYYSGENPASGVTLTTSPQTFVASLAGSATIKWDFSWETATAFADGTQKSSTITLTGVSP